MLSLAATASADTLYMHVQTSDGNWQVFSLDQVDRLTFTGGKMTALTAEGTTVASFPSSSLVSMNFDEISAPSGVESAVADPAELSVSGNVITYAGKEPAAVEIFDAAGRAIEAISAVENGQSIDLSALSPDVYIVKAGLSTIKIAVK